MFSVLIGVSLFLTLLVTAYLYVQNAFTYWKRKNLPYLKPQFPFGNFSKSFLQKISFTEELQDIYNNSKEPVIGIYTTLKPTLLIRDPKLIQEILVKEFSSFSHRGMYANEEVDPMADNILLQHGEKWKRMRSQLSPTFTSGRLKEMFDLIIPCADSLYEYIEPFAGSGKTIEVREVFACFTTNVIASSAFGIDVDCIKDPKNVFRQYGRIFFEPTFKNALRSNISLMNPALAKLLRLRFTDKEVQDFFTETCRQNLEYREKNNVTRKDFFQLLIQWRNTGKVQKDGDWNIKSSSDQKSLSLNEIAAQSFLFFVGGYESTSTTMSFCLYELAKNSMIQDQAYNEICAVLEKHNGKLNYDSLNEMKYIEHCIDETLRMHPPFGALSRQCTKDFQILNSVIEKDTIVMFSVVGLHYDSKYYDQPEIFMPERFDEMKSAGKNFIDMPYLAFGDGPRNCLGLRLAKMQTKLAIVLLLKKFRFELSEEHKTTKLKLNPKSIVKAPISGINLLVSSRK